MQLAAEINLGEDGGKLLLVVEVHAQHGCQHGLRGLVDGANQVQEEALYADDVSLDVLDL